MNAIKSLKFTCGLGNVGMRTVFPYDAKSWISNAIGVFTQNQAFSSFSASPKCLNVNQLSLISNSCNLVPSRGMKVRGRLVRRCKDCYFARFDERMYVLCNSYPRHKQMALAKKLKYTWILTHCSQTKLRPY